MSKVIDYIAIMSKQKKVDKPSENSIYSKLQTLAEKQGFVTESQINVLASTPDDDRKIRGFLSDQQIVVQPDSTLERKNSKLRKGARAGRVHYSEPTWIYLNSLGRVPLMSRGQEVQHSILIRFALYKLMDIAFRELTIVNSVCNLAGKLECGAAECVDVLRIEEDRINSPSEIEKTKTNFLKSVQVIKKDLLELDKLKNKPDPDENLVIISGRVSSEMLLKVAARGSPLLLTKAVPTDMGISLAKELGITLVRCSRDSAVTAYCNDWRIAG